MSIKIKLKITPFGSLKLKFGNAMPTAVDQPTIPVQKDFHYIEPQETVLKSYEVQYKEKQGNYCVPLTTA